MLLLWALRFLIFRLYESPKFLMGAGRDEDAVKVVHAVAHYNGVQSSLTLERLQSVGNWGGNRQVDTSRGAAVRRKMAIFRMEHVRPLFATRKMAYSTSILIALWGVPPPFPCLCSLVSHRSICSYHWPCIPVVQCIRHLLVGQSQVSDTLTYLLTPDFTVLQLAGPTLATHRSPPLTATCVTLQFFDYQSCSSRC
jgi:hypothetical protein